ncbi:hypothetical protein ACFE04_006626 [Oxalis oulophora]
MKSSFGKLRRFATLHHNHHNHKSSGEHGKDKIDILQQQQSVLLDDLSQATEEMQNMRNCYDSLLSAAAATANSAYEFSESLKEMGSCMLEKTSLHDDAESGKVLQMLGNSQFELQKIVDRYVSGLFHVRSHIFLTITNPSESLLNELRTVEDMKRQCDEKRNLCEFMKAQQKEKGKSKGGKGETFNLPELQTAQEAFNEEATFCVFRLKSLKQGQSRSLLTQVARHHAAQLNFFRKGLKSLETIEPFIRQVTEQHHIDYQFQGLDDNYEKGEDDDYENDYDLNEGELSFDYRVNKRGLDAVPISTNSMEVDEGDISFPRVSTTENAEVSLDYSHGDYQSREHRVSSFSAPLFPAKKVEPSEKIKQRQQSFSIKPNAYVLPTPNDTTKCPIPPRSSISALPTRPTNLSGRTPLLWHSSPLEQQKNKKDSTDGQPPPPVLKESNNNNASTPLPPPLADGPAISRQDTYKASDSKKIKRQAFSGPLSSGPTIIPTEYPQQTSGSPPKAPILSSPRINELHELPRPPPANFSNRPLKAPGLVGHSAPLVFKNQESTSVMKTPSAALNPTASPLPTPPPPLIVPRSFSIPSSSQRAMALHVSKLLETPKASERPKDLESPPLTPISLTNIKLISVSETAPRPSPPMRGE